MAKWLAALIILFPLSFHQREYRSGFTRGLALHIKRASPAYAAFEDMSHDYSSSSKLGGGATEIVRLAAGTFRLHMALAAAPARRLTLPTLVIQKSFQVRQPLQIARGPRMDTPETGLLPIEERKRILVQYFHKQDWSTPSVSERAEQLIQAESAQNPANVDARLIVSDVTHTPIVVAKPGTDLTPLTKGATYIPSRLPSSPGPVIASNSTVTSPRAFRNSVPANAMLSTGPSLTASAAQSAAVASLFLKGQLEIRDGLAFIGPDTYFTLKHINDGTVLEQGRILVSEAKFEIYIKDMVGQLIAELHSRGGDVLGRGYLDLDDTSGENQLKIELTPVAAGASVRVSSGYSDGTHRVSMTGAMVAIDQSGLSQRANDEGIVSDTDRSRRSTYIVRAVANNHWPTLSPGAEGQTEDVLVYPDRLVKSLMALTNSGVDSPTGQTGIVWGRVIKNGQPVAGAQVEMAGDYSPVYFNHYYLPDKTLKATDINGNFAFLSVQPGVQAVRVHFNGKTFPAQVFPADSGHLSYLELRLESNKSVNIAVQDAFDVQKNISAHIRLMGVDDEVQIQGEQKLHYPAGSNATLLEADAGPDYELSRVQLLKSDSHLTVPMIRRDWLKTILDIKQFTLLPERGTVVGIVNDQPFQVQVTGYLPPDQPQLVYFDQSGQIVAGDSGPAGGGFVLFNAPLGMQTLQVKPLASTQVFSQTIVAEPEVVSVFKYSFAETY